MIIINCNCPLNNNKEHWHYTSVETNQSKQGPRFPNLLLLCFLLCTRSPLPPFLLFPEQTRWMGLMQTSLNWSSSWIPKENQHQAPSTSKSLQSSRMDANPKEVVVQEGDGLMWELRTWCPWRNLDLADGPSLVLFWTSS
jgi:hypothetical protein